MPEMASTSRFRGAVGGAMFGQQGHLQIHERRKMGVVYGKIITTSEGDSGSQCSLGLTACVPLSLKTLRSQVIGMDWQQGGGERKIWGSPESGHRPQTVCTEASFCGDA